MNSRELSKSDHEDMSESLKGHHDPGPVTGDVHRRYSKDKTDARTFRKASLAVRSNVVTEVRSDITSSPMMPTVAPTASSRLKAENTALDYSIGCCVISSVKTPKVVVKTITEGHRKASNRTSLRCADRRRGSDPGLNMQVKCLNSEVSHNFCLPPQSVWTGESTRTSARSRKGTCDYVNLREMFLANGVMVNPEMDSSRSMTSHPYDQCQTADSRRHWLSFNDRRSNPGPDLCSSPCAVPNRRFQSSQSSLRHDPQEPCADTHALRRSFRKSRSSSRKECSASRDTVSEFGGENSAPPSPLLKRRSSKKKTAAKSRDVAQTTNTNGSGEVFVMTEKNPVPENSKKATQRADNTGCHATTQTEWHSGWEPVPGGFLPVFRTRIQQTLPQNPKPLCVSKDVRDSGCSTPEHQILNDIPLPSMRYPQELQLGKPCLFDMPPDTSSRLSSERSSATGWGSMDNLGFLSSGDSSDQTRAAASASSSKPRPRAKDDWALYRSPRSDEHQNAALPRYQSDTSLDREMAQLSQEMASIQMECEVLVSRHINERLKGVGIQGTSSIVPPFLLPQSSSHRQPPLEKDDHPSQSSLVDQAAHLILNQNKPSNEEEDSVNDWINTSTYKHLQRADSEKSSSDHEVEEEESKDSSSAYNTGESSGSTAMGQAGSNTSGEFQKSLMTMITDKVELETQESQDAPEASCNYCDKLKEASCQCSEECKIADEDEVPCGAKKDAPQDANEVFHPSFSPGTIMYTNEAHLQHTIFLQQQLLRRALTLSGSTDLDCQSSISLHKEIVNSQCFSGQEEDSSTSKTPETEWRVKRRPDGTRYITRRPSRTKILKERALRISEERRGLTTDEDATSEMKLGRYWSREERKRHLERARERRKKEGNIGRSKLAVVKEGRLSLVVVQEEETLVSPGSRKSNSSGKYLQLYPALTTVNHYTKLARTSAILSVTTV